MLSFGSPPQEPDKHKFRKGPKFHSHGAQDGLARLSAKGPKFHSHGAQDGLARLNASSSALETRLRHLLQYSRTKGVRGLLYLYLSAVFLWFWGRESRSGLSTHLTYGPVRQSCPFVVVSFRSACLFFLGISSDHRAQE